jgi:hypothetical protein
MKMEFLTEASAQAVDPDDATLAAHLAAHPERFARAPLVAFEQILLDEGRGPRRRYGNPRQPERRPRPGGGRPAEPAAGRLPGQPAQVVDGTFGTGFFEALAGLPEGRWAGPVTTPLGRHLVRVTERRKGGLPPLAAIRERVLQDWRATRAAELREERFEAMRARYHITRPDAAEVLGR